MQKAKGRCWVGRFQQQMLAEQYSTSASLNTVVMTVTGASVTIVLQHVLCYSKSLLLLEVGMSSSVLKKHLAQYR